jgi:ribonuclease HII
MQFPHEPADLGEYQRIAENAGFLLCVGVDEAGRGPLAGPVTAAAVHLPQSVSIPELNDSKQLSESVRKRLFEVITTTDGILWNIVDVSQQRVDEINILQATHEAMRLAVSGLSGTPDLVLVDGNPVKGFDCAAVNVIKGDAKCAAIAAASILAKVHRDGLMCEFDETYPEYGFSRHKGYGTKAHLEALRSHGPCPVHRRSFAPVRDLLSQSRQGWLF